MGSSISQGVHWLNDSYTYNTNGVINTVTPDNGPVGGGNIVTITGYNLGDTSDMDITSVKLVGVEVASIDSQNATHIVVTAGSIGIGNQATGPVIVKSISQGVTKLNNTYTYNANGVINTVTPNNG